MSKAKNTKANDQSMVTDLLSYIALILLGGLAYLGVMSEIDAKPTIQQAIALIVVALLIKTALKK